MEGMFEKEKIPVHILEPKRSWKLNAMHCPCVEAIAKEKEIVKTEMLRLMLNNKTMLGRVAARTGESFAGTNVQRLFMLYDTLHAEQLYFGSRWQRPEWLDEEMMRSLKHINDYTFREVGKYQDYIQLRAGNFLYEIIKAQHKMANNENDGFKIQAYSSHETSITPILHALGLFKGFQNS